MNEIIEEAIITFRLDSSEEYYFDESDRLRARGFMYDEDTGIYLNEYGLLLYEEPILEKDQEAIRELLNFSVNIAEKLLLTEITESELIVEAVA